MATNNVKKATVFQSLFNFHLHMKKRGKIGGGRGGSSTRCTFYITSGFSLCELCYCKCSLYWVCAYMDSRNITALREYICQIKCRFFWRVQIGTCILVVGLTEVRGRRGLFSAQPLLW